MNATEPPPPPPAAQGRQAARLRLGREANPYRRGSREYREWRDAWIVEAARAMLEEGAHWRVIGEVEDSVTTSGGGSEGGR